MSEQIASIGRNEPCPCGSGKKYKRCCGADAAPKLSTPNPNNAPYNPMGAGLGGGPSGGMPGGLDPSQLPGGLPTGFDPQMMVQFSQLLGRLPKGQLQKLQSIMQKAMSGKDVTREAKDFEQTLPLDIQTLLSGFKMPGMDPMSAMNGAADGLPGGGMPDIDLSQLGFGEGQMTEEEARAIVESAAKEGKISGDQAQDLLKASPDGASPKGISNLWKKMSGK